MPVNNIYIFNIGSYVSNQDIRTRMNAEDRIKNKGLNWFGHVLRMEEERWPKQLLSVEATREKETRKTKKVMEGRNDDRNAEQRTQY
jgi:hypothetical protein